MKLVVLISALGAVISASNGQIFYPSLMPQYPNYFGQVIYPNQFQHHVNINPYYVMPMIGEKHALRIN